MTHHAGIEYDLARGGLDGPEKFTLKMASILKY
jgi:hypothetical protein